jgi:hypothetical protein
MTTRKSAYALGATDLDLIPLEPRLLLGSDPFTHRLFYPEGFAGATITEFLPLACPGDVGAEVRVVAHFETGERDLEIAHELLAPHSRTGVTISRAGDEASSLVPWGRPYSIEVDSTAPISANLSHYDFGAGAGEALVGEDAFGTDWTIVSAAAGPFVGVHDFVVWYNPGDADANITVELRPEDAGTPTFITTTTGALRRGGLNLADVTVDHPAFHYSVRVTSDQPILAALSSYTPGPNGSPNAFTTLGERGAGSTFGIVPLAQTNIAPNIQVVQIYNPDPEATASVSLSLSFPGGSPAPVVLPAMVQPRNLLNYQIPATGDIPGGAKFSIAYSSSLPVFVQSVHLVSIAAPPPAPFGARTDLLASATIHEASTSINFADGFMDDTRAGLDLFETLSVYNPHSSLTSLGAGDAPVSIRFSYADGFVLLAQFTLAAGDSRIIDLHTYEPILAQAREHARYFYSIEVASDVGVVAQEWHVDFSLSGLIPGGGFSTSGALLGTLIPFTGSVG